MGNSGFVDISTTSSILSIIPSEYTNPTEIKLGGNEINEDNVVITFAVDDSARKDYQSLIKEFHQQNPSITVMLVTPPGDFSIWNEDDLRSLASAADATIILDGRGKLVNNATMGEVRNITKIETIKTKG